jgi:hypothetical protein
VTAGSAPSLPVVLSAREASLRSAAATCLAGIALLQAIDLPSLLVQGAQLVALSAAVTALCVGLSLALAAAPASASRQLWRAVAATAVFVVAAWAAPHAVSRPDEAGAGDWGSMPGVACGGLAAACLPLASAAVRSTRATARGIATALVVLVTLGPGLGALLVALGPGPVGGETAITADVHVHKRLTAAERDIRFRPGRGGNHYVTPIATRPHAPALGIALLVVAAFAFVSGAIAHLRWRTAPTGPGLEGRAA